LHFPKLLLHLHGMNKQPLIKQPWIRVLLFVITYLAISMLMSIVAETTIAALKLNNDASAGATDGPDVAGGKILLIRVLLSIAASILTVFFFRTLADRQSFSSLGFDWNNHQAYGATGFFLGILILGVGSFILIANKNLFWTDITFNASQLFLGVGLMALVSFSEEIVFRGYILNNLLQSVNKWWALIISALIFALFHMYNPGITFFAVLNVFLAGLMLGINYIYTRNLWFGLLLHFSWNFYQGPVLGYKVSGFNVQSLLQQELSGHPLLTGGAFGFEGSLLDGLLSLLTALVLAMIYEKKFAGPARPSPVS